MEEFDLSKILELSKNLSLYQYVGEIFAVILLFVSLLPNNLFQRFRFYNLKSLKNFLRSTSFLIAFATLAVPWIISDIFINK